MSSPTGTPPAASPLGAAGPAASTAIDAINALTAALTSLLSSTTSTTSPTTSTPEDSPYSGAALNLFERHGAALYDSASKALPSNYTGRIDCLQTFIGDVDTRAKRCFWDSAVHGILTVTNPAGERYSLLQDYGKITAADVESARVARAAVGYSMRAKQNARMMYDCITSSLTEEARAALYSKQGVDYHNDGPTLFYALVVDVFKATFSSAQATRDRLQALHPKSLKYDIRLVNAFLRTGVQALRASGPVNNDEVLYLQFKAYKRIRSPDEWASKVLFLENSVTPATTPEEVYSHLENHYQKLVDQGLWKPSDQSSAEQALALLGTKTPTEPSNKPAPSAKDDRKKRSAKPTKNARQDKQKSPPFSKSSGKHGDTKKWNGKTYHFCPAPHKNSQWHTHSVDECNVHTKWVADGRPSTLPTTTSKNKVVVDRDALKKGMAALFADQDPEDLVDGLMAILQQ
jgi:hypothetical protein